MANTKSAGGPQDHVAALEAVQPVIKPGSAEHEAMLQAGYGMTIEEAKKIIKERDENPQTWPLEEYRKAQAMIEAFGAKPEVLSTKEPWRIRGHARVVR